MGLSRTDKALRLPIQFGDELWRKYRYIHISTGKAKRPASELYRVGK